MDPTDILVQTFSTWTGFPVDQVRLVVALVLAYPLGFFFYHVLSPRRVSIAARHAFSAIAGIVLGWISIRWHVLLLFGLVGGSYALLLLLPPTVVQRYTMIWAMAYLGVCNMYRIVNTSYGDYTVDFSGRMMIQVTKVTYVAFALHDGLGRKELDLSKDQKEQRVTALPSLLEYLSYTFNFHSLLVGPTYTFREHLSFMDGSYRVQESGDPVKPLTLPYPIFAVVSKLVYALLCLAVLFGVGHYYSSENALDPTHMSSFPSMPITVFLVGYLFYSRYFFIWLLAESINNAAGLGFNGYDKSGSQKWDLVKNAHVLGTHFATNTRAAMSLWNPTVGLWLRRIVYERVQFFSPAIATMFVSAWWHGVYPAYYASGLCVGISIEAARKTRRLFRPYFLSTKAIKMFYDAVTIVITRIFFDFITLPLLFLTLEKTLLFWSYYYYIPFISVFAAALLLPDVKRKETRNGGIDTINGKVNGREIKTE